MWCENCKIQMSSGNRVHDIYCYHFMVTYIPSAGSGADDFILGVKMSGIGTSVIVITLLVKFTQTLAESPSCTTTSGPENSIPTMYTNIIFSCNQIS